MPITLDFETYSEAGYVWIDDVPKALFKNNPGIKGVGAAVYAADPTAEALCMAYDLEDGAGVHIWLPGMPNPQNLFDAVSAGATIEAHNAGFEFLIFNLVCVKKYNWPWIYSASMSCSQAKALAFGLPPALKNVAKILGSTEQKDKEGRRLIFKFSVPRKATKAFPGRRIYPKDDPKNFDNMIKYCIQDVNTERDISARIPDLTPFEQKVWQVDQKINQRGVHIDRGALEDCIAVVEQAFNKYTQELQTITGGAVQTVDELDKFKAWLSANECGTVSLDKEHIENMLTWDIPPNVRRALEIRQILGSASVKKLYALKRYLMSDDRIRYLYQYCGAMRTGRFTGRGPQPHNFTKGDEDFNVDAALAVMAYRDLATVEALYGDPLTAVSNCLRGLLTAAPGAELICSDYASIEARVIAYLAGEQWRIDVFESHGLIYEKTASMISGVLFQEFIDHKKRTGKHHPLRATLGKIPELASGFGGSVGAWMQAINKSVLESKGKIKFEDFYKEDEQGTVENKIKADVTRWRKTSPKIVNLWWTLEAACKDAIQYPGRKFEIYGLTIWVLNGNLHIKLLSGRDLVYQNVRITPYGKYGPEIAYDGIKDHQWVMITTYGGKLVENVVQGIARDILAFGLVNVENAGYPVVLHTHDEIGSEVMADTGSIEEYERIMSTMPAWCANWNVFAHGGWRGHRYRKD